MTGLRNSETTHGVEVLTVDEYNALTPPKQGVLYVVGVIQPGAYTESTYTEEIYTASTFNAGTFTTGETTDAGKIAAYDAYVAPTYVASEYTASEYMASSHDFERVAISAVYNGSREQTILIDNNDKVVWISDTIRDVDTFTNTPVIVEDLV